MRLHARGAVPKPRWRHGPDCEDCFGHPAPDQILSGTKLFRSGVYAVIAIERMEWLVQEKRRRTKQAEVEDFQAVSYTHLTLPTILLV